MRGSIFNAHALSYEGTRDTALSILSVLDFHTTPHLVLPAAESRKGRRQRRGGVPLGGPARWRPRSPPAVPLRGPAHWRPRSAPALERLGGAHVGERLQAQLEHLACPPRTPLWLGSRRARERRAGRRQSLGPGPAGGGGSRHAAGRARARWGGGVGAPDGVATEEFCAIKRG